MMQSHRNTGSDLPIAPISVLCGILHAWIAWRIAPELVRSGGGSVIAGTFVVYLLGSALLIVLSIAGWRRYQGNLCRRVVTWAGLLCLGLFSSLLVLTVLRDALLVLAQLLVAAGARASLYGSLASASAIAVPLLGFTASVGGFWNARCSPRVLRVDVPIAGLPTALHGFTVAQISDLHVGPTISHRYVRRVVHQVNALRADMVAVTGDLVDGTVADLAAHVAPMALLRSRHGTFFVTGNHEYYSGVQPWIEELRRLGLTVLINAHVVLQHRLDAGAAEVLTAELLVAGVADFGAHRFVPWHRSDPQSALSGAPERVDARLLLAHQPRTASAAALLGFDLQLSGHTHGGQIWPWNHFVRFQQPYTCGLQRVGEMWIYINRGTGYWGPPKRLGVPSEITHLRLVPAA